ncbi:Hypothetical protein CINCED_3A000581 [Cinara cedri]|uniref:Uncharacterized protein n=1 Tax=Cinara cedri TaxID=506608 RepID=A0A5E4M140_9HEMI|nr:Hypothetical protein CINCED_3A000581 [Cinara cedri]
MNVSRLNCLILFNDERDDDSKQLSVERALIRQRTVYRLSDEGFRNFWISKRTHFERVANNFTRIRKTLKRTRNLKFLTSKDIPSVITYQLIPVLSTKQIRNLCSYRK